MTEPDVISELPKNITDQILIKLPQKEAIRTSILSTKWRYKWLSLPQLIFDYPFNYNFSNPTELTNLIPQIYQSLLLHNGPLINFSFSISNSNNFSSHINHWLHFLSTIKIQHFCLRIWRGNPQKLSSHFYSFQQLKHLNLFNCIFKPPASFRGFENLVSLEFRNVVFVAERFGIFVSNCPFLEKLTLEGCPHFFCLRISCPNLKLLCFNGSFDSINLKNCPNLEIVSIGLNGMAEISKYFIDRKSCNLVEIASSIPQIQELSIHLHFLKFLAKGGVQNRLPRSLEELRKVEISDLCFEKKEEVSCALCLISSSPNLERLTIIAQTDKNADMEGVVELLRWQDFSECSLNKLKTVKMEEISGVEAELELMKYLLANSSNLEIFEILPIKDTDKGFQILKELIRFRRASAKAQIIYYDDLV
ncbi:F-box/FBD/LRR-repeat protein At1g13570-like [Euphorbia lathyris]|uniref:F-box/FBD/LRR-repeat protein At1g13570-like n=1 Tax=Euphorbia lathyris TaxID=212925 RepID=UPI003313C705